MSVKMGDTFIGTDIVNLIKLWRNRRMSKIELSNNAVHFFVNYVKERNVSIMTKSEWEQLYFYCTAKFIFNEKKLIELSTDDLYEIADKLQIDFSKVTFLVKKCYRFEYKDVKEMNFHALFEKQAILNPVIENKTVRFSVTNSLVQERLEEIFNKAGIFSDTSFKKNIFTIPTAQFLTLIEKENQTLITKLRNNKDVLIQSIKEKLNIDSDSKTKEIQNLINQNDAKNTIKAVSEIASKIASSISVPQNIVAEIIINIISNEDSVLSSLKSVAI